MVGDDGFVKFDIRLLLSAHNRRALAQSPEPSHKYENEVVKVEIPVAGV